MKKTKELDNSHITKHLGKTSEYKSTYDASLLVREPRANNREHLDIDDNDLPFVGYDTWNAYEFSTLTSQGMPVVGVLKLVYPCDSAYIVESKSFKLYLNSFNMQRSGDTAKSAVDAVVNIIEQDMSSLLGTDARVYIHGSASLNNCVITASQEYGMDGKPYITIEDDYPVSGVKFTKYAEDSSILRVIDQETQDGDFYHSALLKSNCRVTGQPDWGDVFVRLKGKKTVDPISLLQYIVSFRDECHFHEEICETIYKRLHDLCEPDELGVQCLYARRGGIDICPIRASADRLIDIPTVDCKSTHVKTAKQ